MKDRRSNYRVLALAAHAALDFAARRKARNRHLARRRMTLFWRQKRKRLEGVQARRVAPAGVVLAPQFHMQFITSAVDRPMRDSILRLLPVVASHQTRVVMENRRTIIQSRIYLAQPRRAQSTVQVSSLRHAQSDSGTKLQTTAQYPNSARQPIAPATTTWGAVRAQFPVRGSSRRVNRPQSPNLGRTHPRVRRGQSVDGKDQTFQAVQTYTIEPHLFRSRSVVMRHSVPPRSQESTPAQLYFQPQELVWHRAMQPAAEIAGNRRQWDLDALEEPSHGRSFTGKEAVSGMPHLSGHAPATPAIKIDSALMDRMADDVIRRLERRARIERARQGL